MMKDHLHQSEILEVINKMIGILVMLVIAYKWSDYIELLHENATWFSNVDQMEREISFRTEQGLYYSYFKEFVAAPSFREAIYALKFDNITEHTNTINIFHRFNIHEEVILGTMYRINNFGLEPIFFYIKSVFALSGILICAFYLIAWSVSGTWVAGVLTVAYVVCHRTEVTRVEFTMALREHFSLPFVFLQFASVGRYLKYKHLDNEKFHWVRMYVLTLLFALFWQFAQFVQLLQSLVLFGLAILRLVDKDRVCKVLAIHVLAIVSVWYLQYYQPMVLSSLVVCFIPIAILLLQSQSSVIQPLSPIRYLLVSSVKIVLPLLLAIVINMGIKFLLDLNDDNHILHFIKSKLGFSDVTNFETRLYLCLATFQTLPWSKIRNFIPTLALPFYAFIVFVNCVSILMSIVNRQAIALGKKDEKDDGDLHNNKQHQQPKDHRNVTASSVESEKIKNQEDENEKKTIFDGINRGPLRFLTNVQERPESCFHLCMSIVLGVLAMSTLRMKCFWFPYICIGASVLICDTNLWNCAVRALWGTKTSVYNGNLIQFLRHLVLIFAILHLYQSQKKPLITELDDLRELHDPDTVDLMEWINQSTDSNSAFTGSMQLLAGVKLCTKRHVTNHPHFEDKALRQRTKELYAIYSKVSPEHVYQVLLKYDSSYIILEDSICLGSSISRCSLTDTMDLTNGHIPDDGIRDLPHLKKSFYPRFCNEIRHGGSAYAKYFRRVFSNRTFRVYQIKK